jgi:hypothetical protein
MNRPLLTIAFFAAATAALAAQQASPSGAYEGVSNPPPDDTIKIDAQEPPAKPPAGQPLQTQPAAPAQQTYAAPSMTTPTQPASGYRGQRDGTDEGIVQAAESAPGSTTPTLVNRSYVPDPDDGIVHPAPLPPGEMEEGTLIRVRLLNDLSSSFSKPGEPFQSTVATDVVAGGEVVIPAGSRIEGKVVDVSTGHFGGHGTLLLEPQTVTLPSGEQFRLHAVVESAPGTHSRANAEGVIGPDSQLKRNGIEYGGAVGVGVVAGATLGGPAGALAGGIIGAGLVTTHLLVSHPQVHLDSGDVLVLALTARSRLVPAKESGE